MLQAAGIIAGAGGYTAAGLKNAGEMVGLPGSKVRLDWLPDGESLAGPMAEPADQSALVQGTGEQLKSDAKDAANTVESATNNAAHKVRQEEGHLLPCFADTSRHLCLACQQACLQAIPMMCAGSKRRKWREQVCAADQG